MCFDWFKKDKYSKLTREEVTDAIFELEKELKAFHAILQTQKRNGSARFRSLFYYFFSSALGNPTAASTGNVKAMPCPGLLSPTSL